MKKTISLIFIIIITLMLSTNIYAASLDTLNVTVTKTLIRPGENVVVNLEFGESLGAYTFDIAYDSNLFEYVSSENGTANDNGNRVRIYYFDATGGSSPNTTTSVRFKAKSDIISSNPTQFSITAEGLANSDASVSYDDITVGIIKDVVVEPEFEDYKINLLYTGDIVEEESKDMSLTIESSLGENFDKTRLIAEAITPGGASVKLNVIDSDENTRDMIDSGYGSVDGDSIGGENVLKQIDISAIFSEEGSYNINFKLINREDSDSIIAQQDFNFTVDAAQIEENNGNGENGNENNNNGNNENTQQNEVIDPEDLNGNIEVQEVPETLPKTGSTIYINIAMILFGLIGLYYISKKVIM